MTPTVILQNDLNKPKTPDAGQFQIWVNAIFQYIEDRVPENVTELCIRIVDLKESAELNQSFRKKLGATNVLSFSNKIEANIDDKSLGDIAICAELVVSEADEQGLSVEHHWAHLTVHGVLHLLGYNHTTEKETVEMENLEILILKYLNIKNPYQESLDE